MPWSRRQCASCLPKSKSVILFIAAALFLQGDSLTVTPEDDLLAVFRDAPRNSVISFSEGRYTGSCGAVLSKPLTLVSLRGPEATVFDCGSRKRHLSIHGPDVNVTISGFAFWNGFDHDGVGGGCILVERGAELAVENCVFSGCSSNVSGGAMQLIRSRLKMKGALLTNTTAAHSGGALALHYSLGLMDNCTIRGSSAGSNGGAISLLHSSLNAGAVIISQSTALRDGGAVHVIQNSDVVFSESAFSDNTASGSGGALHVEKCNAEASSRISRCSFYRNVAGNSGGAIHLIAAEMQITECHIRGGQATSDGGGVAATGASVVRMDNTSVSQSHAGRRGGGLLVTGASKVVLGGIVVLEGNEARERGGGTHVHDGLLEFDGERLHVSANQAGVAGGGISYSSRVVLKRGSSRVTDNTAETGGGICGMGGKAELEIGVDHELLVEKCSAGLDGGGIALVELARLVFGDSDAIADGASQPGMQLHLRTNAAARNGGAVFKSSLDEMLAEDNLCFIGNLQSTALATLPPASTFRVIMAGNSAGVAGGAVYQESPNLRLCAQLASPPLIQTRRLLTDASFKLENNIAGAFGNDMASMASQIQIIAMQDGVIPGQSVLHFNFSLADSLGQLIQGTTEHPLLHVISALVCSVDTPACTSQTSLQREAFFQTHARNLHSSTLQDRELLRHCPVHTSRIRIHISIFGNPHNVSDTVDIQCALCRSGQSRKEYTWYGVAVWSCESCPNDHYVLDPNNVSHTCQECPAGGRCNGTHLIGLLEGEQWRADHSRGIFVLAHCPPGSEMVGIRNWDARIANEHNAQQCRLCVPEMEYVVDSDRFPCTRCPEGAECDGAGLVGKVKGSVWEADQDLGIYRLIGCPPGHQLINSTDGNGVFLHDAQRCERCETSQYILNPNSTVCQDCAIGGRCDSIRMLTRVSGAAWEQEGGRLRITECDIGHVLVRDPSNPLLDQCYECPPGSYTVQRAIYGTAGERNGPIVTSLGDTTAGGLCVACPIGAQCVGGRLKAQAGYWVRPMAEQRRELGNIGETRVFKCPPDACRDGGACETGREGVVCGVCSSGWAMSAGRCLDCHGDSTAVIVIFLLLAAIVLGVVWYLVAVHPLRQYGASVETESGQSVSCLDRFRGTKQASAGHSSGIFLAYFKVVAGFYQILATFLYTYDVSWGSAHERIMQIASIFSLDVLDFPGFSCLATGVSVEGRVLLFTVAPATFIVTILAPGIVFVLSADRNLTNDAGQRSRVMADAVLGPVMITLFLVYPTVTRSTFSQFNCRDFGGGTWILRSDYSTECPLGGSFLFVWSFLFGLVYALGTFALFYGVLFAHKVPRVARTKMLDERTQEMIQHYQRMQTVLELDAICKACGLDRSEFNDSADTGLSPRLTNSIFRFISGKTQNLTGKALADFLQDKRLFGLSRANVEKVAASHVPKTEVLTESTFHVVMVEMLRLSTDIFGPQTFAALSDHQIELLLKHGHAVTGGDVDERTQLQTMSVRKYEAWASKVSTPNKKGKSRVELNWKLQELMLYLTDIGVLKPGHAWWDGAMGEVEHVYRRRLAFLVQPYKVQCWYWDLFELVRAGVFAMIMSFVAPNTPAQLGIGLLVSVVFLAVSVRARPFHDPRAEKLHVFASMALCLTLIYGLVKQLELASSEDTRAAEAILRWISLFSIAGVFFSPFLIELWTTSWHSPKRYIRRWRGPCHLSDLPGPSLDGPAVATQSAGAVLPTSPISRNTSAGPGAPGEHGEEFQEATGDSPKRALSDRSQIEDQNSLALTISESPRGLIRVADPGHGEGARVTGGIGWTTPDRGARGGGEWHAAALSSSPPAARVQDASGDSQRDDGRNVKAGFQTARDPREEEGVNDPTLVRNVVSIEETGEASGLERSDTASASSPSTREETLSVEPEAREGERKDADWQIIEEEEDLPPEASDVDPELKERVEEWASNTRMVQPQLRQGAGARLFDSDEFPSPRHDGHWGTLYSPYGPSATHRSSTTRNWEFDSVVVMKGAPLQSVEPSPRLGARTPRSTQLPPQISQHLQAATNRYAMSSPNPALEAVNNGVPLSSLKHSMDNLYAAAVGTPQPSPSFQDTVANRPDISATPTKIFQPELSGHRGSAAGVDVILPRAAAARTHPRSRSPPQTEQDGPVFSSLPPQAWVPEQRGVTVFMAEMRPGPEEPDSGRFLV